LDLNDGIAMSTLVEEVTRRFGGIDGVIHTPGTPDRITVDAHTLDSLELTLDQAALGGASLVQAVGSLPLSFLVLCSSAPWRPGAPGALASLATASMLERLAIVVGQERSYPVVALQMDLRGSLGREDQPSEESPMSSDTVLEILGRGLGSGATSLLVCDGDPEIPFAGEEVPAEHADGSGNGDGFHPRPESATPYAEPRNEAEEKIASLWSELLGIHPVGIYDNFMELGGDSLLATQISTRLQILFAVEIPLQQVFQKPTIAELADFIDTLRWVSQSPPNNPGITDQEDGEI
jgi:acyl carrier protein